MLITNRFSYIPNPQTDNQQNATHYPPTTQSPGPGHTPPMAPYQQQQQPQQPPTDSYQPIHHRPESTYDHPQELGTSVYDSPVERLQFPSAPQGAGQPQYQQQLPQQTAQPEFSSTVYPPDNTPNPSGVANAMNQSQAPYPASPVTQPPPPMQQPPPVPGAAANPAPYPSINPGAGAYQAYKPSQSSMPNNNPASFYQ